MISDLSGKDAHVRSRHKRKRSNENANAALPVTRQPTTDE
jgi:hypothetical protein